MVNLDPLFLGYAGLVAVIGLLVIGMPVAFATIVVGVFGLVLMMGWATALGIVSGIPYATTTNYSLGVIPMFIIMGVFAYHAGITGDLFRTARQWVGHRTGGLAMATILGCAGFAATSGSSVATAAVMSRIALPEMREFGYQPRFAAGVVAAGGTLASLIPPSVILVIYAIVVEQSVRALLVAAVVPGILTVLIYIAFIWIRVRLTPSVAGNMHHEKPPWNERLKSLWSVWSVLFLMGVLIGGMYFGVFTPTEAGAWGALAALALAVARRGLSWKSLWLALLETGRTTVMIFTLLVGVMIFTRFLSFSGLPRHIIDFAVGLDVPSVAVLFAILLVFMVLGMFLEAMGMLMLALPIAFPVVVALGYDPIWFGIVAVKMAEIAIITPPVGLNCFVVASVDKSIPLSSIYRGIIPFWLLDIGIVVFLVAFPQIVLFLPSTLR